MIWMLADYQLGAEPTTYQECVAANVAAGQSLQTAQMACRAAGPWPDAGGASRQDIIPAIGPGSNFKLASMAPVLIGLAVIGIVFVGAKMLWKRKGKR